MGQVPPPLRGRDNRCSFCGKKQSEVRLIAGPGVFICAQCVALCNEVLAHDAAVTGGKPPDPPAGSHPGGATIWTEITSPRDKTPPA